MSVALLRNEAPVEMKITFAGHVSAFGWRPDGEPKLNVIVLTRGGASIYSWTFGVSVRWMSPSVGSILGEQGQQPAHQCRLYARRHRTGA
jgi:hypothetical protein